MKKDNNQILDNLINKLCIESNFYYIKNNDICILCNNLNKLFIKSECSNKEHKICITCVANMKTFDSCDICNIKINNIYKLTECKQCNIIDKNIKYRHNGHDICVDCCEKSDSVCQLCIGIRRSKSSSNRILTASDYSEYNIYNIDYAIHSKNHLFDKIFSNYNDHILLSICLLDYSLDEYIIFLKTIYLFHNFIKNSKNIDFLNCYEYCQKNLINESEYLSFIFYKYKIAQTKKRLLLLIYELVSKYKYQLDKYLEISSYNSSFIYKIKI